MPVRGGGGCVRHRIGNRKVYRPFLCGGLAKGKGEGGSDITYQRLQSCGQAIVVLAGR